MIMIVLILTLTLTLTILLLILILSNNLASCLPRTHSSMARNPPKSHSNSVGYRPRLSNPKR